MESNANYLLQVPHSSHLPLQQVAQSLSLQHSGQLGPAAWTDATVAMKAKAIAVMNDFIIFYFLCKNSKLVMPEKIGPYANSDRDSWRRYRRSATTLIGQLVAEIPAESGLKKRLGAFFLSNQGQRMGELPRRAGSAWARGVRGIFFAIVMGLTATG
jgi:hypothetical protein